MDNIDNVPLGVGRAKQGKGGPTTVTKINIVLLGDLCHELESHPDVTYSIYDLREPRRAAMTLKKKEG